MNRSGGKPFDGATSSPIDAWCPAEARSAGEAVPLCRPGFEGISHRASLLPWAIQLEQPRTVVRCQWQKRALFRAKDQRITRAAHERRLIAVVHKPERVSELVCDHVAHDGGSVQRSHAIRLNDDEEAPVEGARHREDVLLGQEHHDVAAEIDSSLGGVGRVRWGESFGALEISP